MFNTAPIAPSTPPEHCWVPIVAGKHKGKTARFIKRTPKRVAIQLNGDDTVKYLPPNHVDMNGVKNEQDNMGRVASDPLPVSQPISSPQWVSVIKGKHKGKTLRFVKRTPMKVGVQLGDENKVIYLEPSHVNMNDGVSSPHDPPSVPNHVPSETRSAPSPAPSVTTTQSDSTELPQWVSVVKGKHKGKTLRFVKRTPMKVGVQLGDENKVIYLEPSYVNMNEASQNASSTTHHANYATSAVQSAPSDKLPGVTTPWVSVTPPSTDTDDTDSFATASDGESYEFVSTADLLQAQVAEVPTLSNSKDFVPGSRVFITSGSSHVEQVATFVKSTAQRVGVTLESDPNGKIRYFDTKSVSTQRGVAAPLYDVTDPLSQAFREALGDQHPVEFHNSTASKVNQTLFGAIFGEDAVFFEVKTNNLLQLPKELSVPQQKRKLYLTVNKMHEKAKNLSCAYLWAESNREVANRLLEIGAFDKLSQTKAAARLDLLLSTASSSSTTPGTYHVHNTLLSSSDFRLVPEHGNVGCGYIPRWMMDMLLGDGATDVVALQVRIVIPSLGIFKGLLTVKPGIDKIELPTSMQKVGASTSPTANQDSALLMINQTGIYPYAARISRQQNHFADEREIPNMARWMLIQKGVSNTYLCKKNRHHDLCKGLMDPTDGLPSGCVFLAGIQDDVDLFGDKILISRYPMTEASDGLVVPLIKKQPQSMSASNWEFLCRQKFGTVYFGKPPPGERALPEYIAQGDCDGDDYFLCWDPNIVADALIGDRPKLATKKAAAARSTAATRDWWFDAQEFMMDVASRKNCHRLISSLYTMWQGGLKRNKQQEALVFGRASKEAIDAPKHGGKVDLPGELWKHIPRELWCYLNKPAPSSK